MKELIKKFWVYIFIFVFLFGSTILTNHQNKIATQKMTQYIEDFRKDSESLQIDVRRLKITIQKEMARINKDHEKIMHRILEQKN